jgi:hypothetical protein
MGVHREGQIGGSISLKKPNQGFQGVKLGVPEAKSGVSYH